MFLAALDQTIVATAGPELQGTLDLDASLRRSENASSLSR